MLALTIMQPHAHFILGDEPRPFVAPKRVENRPWVTAYRGPLLIHAGASRKWLVEWPRLDPDAFHYAALVGIVDVVASIDVRKAAPDWLARNYPWLTSDPYYSGPCALIFDHVRRFRTPIPCRGLQKLWRPPAALAADIRQAIDSSIEV
jgi:hypothetical protein